MVGTRTSLNRRSASPDEHNSAVARTLHKLEIDGTDYLKGGGKRKRVAEEETESRKQVETYHYRGAVYERIPGTDPAWLENQPERYKGRVPSTSAAGPRGQKRRASFPTHDEEDELAHDERQPPRKRARRGEEAAVSSTRRRHSHLTTTTTTKSEVRRRRYSLPATRPQHSSTSSISTRKQRRNTNNMPPKVHFASPTNKPRKRQSRAPERYGDANSMSERKRGKQPIRRVNNDDDDDDDDVAEEDDASSPPPPPPVTRRSLRKRTALSEAADTIPSLGLKYPGTAQYQEMLESINAARKRAHDDGLWVYPNRNQRVRMHVVKECDPAVYELAMCVPLIARLNSRIEKIKKILSQWEEKGGYERARAIVGKCGREKRAAMRKAKRQNDGNDECDEEGLGGGVLVDVLPRGEDAHEQIRGLLIEAQATSRWTRNVDWSREHFERVGSVIADLDPDLRVEKEEGSKKRRFFVKKSVGVIDVSSWHSDFEEDEVEDGHDDTAALPNDDGEAGLDTDAQPSSQPPSETNLHSDHNTTTTLPRSKRHDSATSPSFPNPPNANKIPPFPRPATNKAGQPLRWTPIPPPQIKDGVHDAHRAEFTIQKSRLAGESDQQRRRRVRREIKVMEAWKAMGPE